MDIRDDGFGFFTGIIVGLFILVYLIGRLTGQAMYKDNTYECTLACGTQNYEVDGTCFCKSKP